MQKVKMEKIIQNTNLLYDSDCFVQHYRFVGIISVLLFINLMWMLVWATRMMSFLLLYWNMNIVNTASLLQILMFIRYSSSAHKTEGML